MGASDVTKISRFTKIKDYKKWINDLVEECAETFDELFFIPDHGVYVDFALAFLKEKGPGSVIAVVPHGEQWLEERARKMNITRVHRMQVGVGWNYLNTHFVGLAPYALYLGYSSGSILELVSSKYLRVYENHPTHFFIDRRSISIPLPKELVEDIVTISYFNSRIGLKSLLEQYVK
jgi:hypothetical protein